MRVLVDVNVILDVLARREQFYANSAAVYTLVDEGRVEGVIAAHTVTTLYYLLSTQKPKPSSSHVTRMLRDCVATFTIVPVDCATLARALDAGWSDFEDAVQWDCALRAGANCVITRDDKDFRNSSVPVFTPTEFLDHLGDGLATSPES